MKRVTIPIGLANVKTIIKNTVNNSKFINLTTQMEWTNSWKENIKSHLEIPRAEQSYVFIQ